MKKKWKPRFIDERTNGRVRGAGDDHGVQSVIADKGDRCADGSLFTVDGRIDLQI